MRAPLLLLALSGCSFSRFDYTECATNDECKSAFGWDSVCGDEGFCEPLAVPERCETTYPADLWTNRAEYNDAVIFGSLYYLGYVDEVRSLELPLRQVNGDDLNGGMDGKLFALIECDDRAFDDGVSYSDGLSYEESVPVYTEWLVGEVGVPAILGPDGSGATESAWLHMEEKGLQALLMAPAATSPSLTNLDGVNFDDQNPGLIWRTAPSDSLQGEAMAQYLFETLSYTKVLLLFPDDAYGRGLKGSFYEGFTTVRGGTVDSVPYTSSTGLSSAVADVASGSYDAVIFLGSSDGVSIPAFLAAANTVDAFVVDEMPIVLADGGYNSDTYNSVEAAQYSDLFNQIIGTAPQIEESGVTDDFRTSFSSIYGAAPEDSSYPVYAYDAAWLVLAGAAWSYYQEGEVNPLGIGRGLRRVSEGTAVDLSPNAWNSGIASSFKAGIGIDVTGATGPLDYDADGETTASIKVWRVVEVDGAYDFEELASITPSVSD
jgi:branched-chain amino acid transport system substrate-binding protein